MPLVLISAAAEPGGHEDLDANERVEGPAAAAEVSEVVKPRPRQPPYHSWGPDLAPSQTAGRLLVKLFEVCLLDLNCSSILTFNNNTNNKMYNYHALINALSSHMIDINLNMIFYTHVEHNPTKRFT